MFSAFLTLAFLASAVNSGSHGSMPASAQIDLATQLARCRAHCIDAFSHRFAKRDSDVSSLTNGQCLADSDCWMCWDYCEMFQTNFEHWGGMCNQRTLCFEGCRLACFVYGTNSVSEDPYQRDLWSFPSSPVLESDTVAGWLRLHWTNVVPLTAAVPPLPHVLYVIFWHSHPNQPWLQLEQTVSTSYETSHGDIVIGGRQAEFLILAVTRDGLVATGRPYTESKTSSADLDIPPTLPAALGLPVVDTNQKAKTQFILAIVGASLLAGLLSSVGLVFLYRMIQAQRRRHLPTRANAIRFRAQSRRRYTSASSRAALITGLNVAKLESTTVEEQQSGQGAIKESSVPENRYTAAPDRYRFADLFKGTIFESPPPYDGARLGDDPTDLRFSFSKDSPVRVEAAIPLTI